MAPGDVTVGPPAPADLGSRTFTAADQRAFAALSGDWNPLHVDAVTARRTLFGTPIVHGVHVLLWALERWLAGRSGQVGLVRLRASFRKPAFVDRSVVARVRTDARNDAHLEVRADDGLALDLAIELGAPASESRDVAIGRWDDPVAPDERTLADVEHAHGEVALAIDPGLARQMFPICMATLGTAAVAELLAITRVVGMHAPGLHSLFAGLTLEAHPTPGSALRFEVVDARAKYSIVPVRVHGPTWRGTLDTFYRPPPASVDANDVARQVAPGEFSEQRALVVGGSRGLGEAFTRLLAAGGARVAFTYHRGEREARHIADDVGALTFSLDVLGPIALPLPWAPTHVYYLATPPIRVSDPYRPFRADELDVMVRCYVTGLHAVIAAALALGGSGLVAWSPSTILLDAPRGLAAYCAAKAAMEELVRQLPALLPVTMFAPRLGRVGTDQTAALIRVAAATPVQVALDQLRLMASARPPDRR